MHVTFLGTGTSHGIPMIGCGCAVCRSTDPLNQRLRPSIFIQHHETNLLVDATPDFRTQALRADIRRVDAVVLTHTHADHVLGLDDLRAFTERNAKPMPIYASAESLKNIQRVFPYACTDKPTWPSLPSFVLRTIEPFQDFRIGALKMRSLPLPHGRVAVFGYLFERVIAYMTDCNAVPPEVVELINGVTVLVIDGLRHRPHPTHLTVADAVEVAREVKPKLTLLTHMCHDLEHRTTEAALPPDVRLAYDGLTLKIENGNWTKLS